MYVWGETNKQTKKTKTKLGHISQFHAVELDCRGEIIGAMFGSDRQAARFLLVILDEATS